MPLWLKGGLIGALILILIAGGESLYDLIYPSYFGLDGIVTCFATFPACALALGVIDEHIDPNLGTSAYIFFSILLYFLIGATIGQAIQWIKTRRAKNHSS